jgi:hypothetical protein
MTKHEGQYKDWNQIVKHALDSHLDTLSFFFQTVNLNKNVQNIYDSAEGNIMMPQSFLGRIWIRTPQVQYHYSLFIIR